MTLHRPALLAAELYRRKAGYLETTAGIIHAYMDALPKEPLVTTQRDVGHFVTSIPAKTVVTYNRLGLRPGNPEPPTVKVDA